MYKKLKQTKCCGRNYLIYGPWYPFVASNSSYMCMWVWGDNSLRWRHDERNGVSNHQPSDCLLNRLFKAPISSASLAFLREIHRWPMNSPHKGPVTRRMFPFDDICVGLTWKLLNVLHARILKFTRVAHCIVRLVVTHLYRRGLRGWISSHRRRAQRANFIPSRYQVCAIEVRIVSANIYGWVQDCNISSVLAIEILQSCTKPSISQFVILQLWCFTVRIHVCKFQLVKVWITIFTHWG